MDSLGPWLSFFPPVLQLGDPFSFQNLPYFTMKRQFFVKPLLRETTTPPSLIIPWRDGIIISFVEFIALLALPGFSRLLRLLWF